MNPLKPYFLAGNKQVSKESKGMGTKVHEILEICSAEASCALGNVQKRHLREATLGQRTLNLLRMNEIPSHHFESMVEPLFVGNYRGINIIAGCLRWRGISSIGICSLLTIWESTAKWGRDGIFLGVAFC